MQGASKIVKHIPAKKESGVARVQRALLDKLHIASDIEKMLTDLTRYLNSTFCIPFN